MSKPAARIGDMHSCPMVTPGTPPIPHVGGPINGPGAPNVLIEGMPAAVVGDMCTCVGPPDSIVMGSTGVLIGGKPAARLGDPTAHGGVITLGSATVLIGETSGGGGGGSSSAAGSINSGASAGTELIIAATEVSSQSASQSMAQAGKLMVASEEGQALCENPEPEDDNSEEEEDCLYDELVIRSSNGDTLKWHPNEEIVPCEIISSEDGKKISTLELQAAGLVVCDKHQGKAVQLISPAFNKELSSDKGSHSIKFPYKYSSILDRNHQQYKFILATCGQGAKEFFVRVFPYYAAKLKLDLDFMISLKEFTEGKAGVGGELNYKWNNKSGGIKLEVSVKRGELIKFSCTPSGSWNEHEFKIALNNYKVYWKSFENLMSGIDSFKNFISAFSPVSNLQEKKPGIKDIEISTGLEYEYSQSLDFYKKFQVVEKVSHGIRGTVIKVSWMADITDKVLSLLGFVAGSVVSGFLTIMELYKLGKFSIKAGFDDVSIKGKVSFDKFCRPGSDEIIEKKVTGSLQGFIIFKLEVDTKIKIGIGYKGLKAGAKGAGLKVESSTGDKDFFKIYFTGAKLEISLYSEMPGVDVSQNESALDQLSSVANADSNIEVEYKSTIKIMDQKLIYP